MRPQVSAARLGSLCLLRRRYKWAIRFAAANLAMVESGFTEPDLAGFHARMLSTCEKILAAPSASVIAERFLWRLIPSVLKLDEAHFSRKCETFKSGFSVGTLDEYCQLREREKP
jgi:hypothetical protein